MSLNSVAERFRQAVLALNVDPVPTLEVVNEYQHAMHSLAMEACEDDGLTDEERTLLRARASCLNFGDAAVDGDARVSVGDDEAWVQAWVRVPR